MQYVGQWAHVNTLIVCEAQPQHINKINSLKPLCRRSYWVLQDFQDFRTNVLISVYLKTSFIVQEFPDEQEAC